MVFDILTTFPTAFSYLNESMLKRAQEKELVTINIHNLRDWAEDKHKTTDDRPFGGNPGMLMKIEPIYKALKSIGAYPNKDQATKVILTSAKGKVWSQNTAQVYAQTLERIVIICGHYEGIDHRVEEFLVDEEVSVGNYVLSGGELPAMVIADSVSRLLSGVLGNERSLSEESVSNGSDLLEYPQYTRPATFTTDEGDEWSVPEVLLSGNHREIEEWQKSNLRKSPQ